MSKRAGGADGTRHVRYDRLVDGLPVVGGDHVVAKAPGGPISDQQWNARKDASPAPETATVSSASAERTARGAAGYPDRRVPRAGSWSSPPSAPRGSPGR